MRHSLLMLSLFAVACEAPGPDVTNNGFEGDEPGECSDAADNDRDGRFDCDDQDCWASPDCTDVDTGTDPDTDGGTDPAATAVAGHFDAMELVYTQTHDIGAGDDTIDAIACNDWALCDCVMEFTGTGTFVSAEDDLVTFFGTWELSNAGAEDACSATIQAGTWVPDDGASYHSFRFTDGLDRLDQWVAHADEPDVDPQLSPSLITNEQFAIWLMWAHVDGETNTVEHEESGVGVIGLFQDLTTHEVTVTFTE